MPNPVKVQNVKMTCYTISTVVNYQKYQPVRSRPWPVGPLGQLGRLAQRGVTVAGSRDFELAGQMLPTVSQNM